MIAVPCLIRRSAWHEGCRSLPPRAKRARSAFTNSYARRGESPQPLRSGVASMALALRALLGLEVATLRAGAIHDAERTIRRATVPGTVLAGLTTVAAVTAVIGIVPVAQLEISTPPMADAARRLQGIIGIALVAAISCLGALNGWLLITAQVSFATARDGSLPAPFARLDGNGTPAFGVLVGAALASLLVAVNYSRSLVDLFTFSILLATVGTLLPYCAGAAVWLFRGGRGGKPIAAFALACSVYALLGTGAEALAWGAALLLAGSPLYLWMKRRPRRAAGV